jgi:hypothetical protein
MDSVATNDKFDRTPAELQQYLLCCILTTGNSAEFAENEADVITAEVPDAVMPCDFLLQNENLEDYVRSKKRLENTAGCCKQYAKLLS